MPAPPVGRPSGVPVRAQTERWPPARTSGIMDPPFSLTQPAMTPLPLATVRLAQAQADVANAELSMALEAPHPDVHRVARAFDMGATLKALGLTAEGGQPNALLHDAIHHGDQPLLVLLLDQGACPNGLNDQNRTPLLEAVGGGATWAVPLLAAAGADPTLVGDPTEGNAVELALRNEDDGMLDALLALPGVTIPLMDARSGTGLNGDMPLLLQARTERAAMALLEAGADPQWRSRCLDHDPLISVLLHRVSRPPDAACAAVVRVLIEADAPVPDDALYQAARTGMAEVLEVLDAAGMDWYAPNQDNFNFGHTPLEVLLKNQTAPHLADHWSRVLAARQLAGGLELALVDGHEPKPPRVRL